MSGSMQQLAHELSSCTPCSLHQASAACGMQVPADAAEKAQAGYHLYHC